MTISVELEAKILRYFHVEKWRRGTIARQLGVHRDTVARVLRQAGIPQAHLLQKPSMIDDFLPFINKTLAKYPTLTASRLYDMVRERGYSGSSSHFRHMIGIHRPRPYAEAYHRLKTLPGEQAQVDWGHFGHVTIGRVNRPLIAFVMVLSYSRKIFLQFYLNQRMSNFLLGHVAAFTAWGGVPRVLLYDNLKSAVLERRADAIRFHPTLLEFAGYYRYEPRPVAVARGNEKGRVERAIRYIRENFFAARDWRDIDDLNQQATLWSEGTATERLCPGSHDKKICDVFIEEQPRLIALPDNPYPCEEREEVNIGKTPYARFDLNDYSVPHTHVRRTLTILATTKLIKILDAGTVIAEHARSYNKGDQVEQESHIKELTQRKSRARDHRGQNRLSHAIPSSVEFFKQAAERGYPLQTAIRQLLKLLDKYGSAELGVAIEESLLRGIPHTNTVRLCLERRREARQQPPTLEIELSSDKRVRELVIKPHKLSDYDQLKENTNE